MRTTLRSLALSVAIALLLAACAGSVASTDARPRPSGIGVASAAEAAGRVLEAHPQFAGIGPQNNDLIGQCCWYKTESAPNGFTVQVHVGWGDCPSGCIENHEWLYSVSAADGSIALLSEDGAPVPADQPGAGVPGTGGSGGTGITGSAMAGPTCPVEQPNDPRCAPRPVAGATIVVKTLDGAVVGQATTDAAGHFEIQVPPGGYTVESQPVQGQTFPIPPEPVAVTVVAEVQTDVQLQFDTGIR